jgi:acetyl-CoA acetyltransferase
VRPVAIVAFAQLPAVRRDQERQEAELVQPVVARALADVGLHRRDVGFTCSGSCDYLVGRPFSFVAALDALGGWPPIAESHVEMDGAWAMYEAWIRLQHDDIDVALAYGFGKSSPGDLPAVLTSQLDPYYLAPLGPDALSLAALQSRAVLDAGLATERDLAAIAARNRNAALANPFAQLRGSDDVDTLMESPYVAAPLRRHDCPPISDGAAAVILVAGDRARELCERPAWIRGMDHRIEPHALGMRDLTRSRSTEIAALEAGVGEGPVDVVEVHAPFTAQEVVLRGALGPGFGADTILNPSGGAAAANPMMVAGLTRFGEAARRIHDGTAQTAIAHATSGPCLQHNLVGVLGSRP